ncbi:MAG: RusA family crossover junction endodeoxyribonuclease [Clostridium sp.]
MSQIVVIDGKIKGKARPRFNRKTGHAVTPKDTLSYENWVKHCYIEQSGKQLNGAVRANITAYYKIPKSYSKKRIQGILSGLEYPTKKPDGDNIAKIILDSLNKIAFDDDAQVVELVILKRYTEVNERVEIILEEILK